MQALLKEGMKKQPRRGSLELTGKEGKMIYIHEERHCHRDGTVTVRRWCSTEKRKPRRKRRGNHRMRRALIRQRKGR